MREAGSRLGHLTGGRWFLLRESGAVVLLLTSAASPPWRASHTGAGNAPPSLSQDSEVWSVEGGGGGGSED